MKSKNNKPGILEVVALLSTIFFFGAMNSGSFLAFLFLYLTPLPLFILGLKKDSPWGGLVGAIGAILIFFVTTPQMSLIYLLAVAAPATYFCEKATSRSDPPHQNWYSLSNLAIFLVVPPIFVFILVSTWKLFFLIYSVLLVCYWSTFSSPSISYKQLIYVLAILFLSFSQSILSKSISSILYLWSFLILTCLLTSLLYSSVSAGESSCNLFLSYYL